MVFLAMGLPLTKFQRSENDKYVPPKDVPLTSHQGDIVLGFRMPQLR